MADNEQLQTVLSAIEDAIDAEDAIGLPSTGGILACKGIPQINIKGIGQLSLPLCECQITKLHEMGEIAPFGKGEETVIDENVRKARQIEASLVSMGESFHNSLRSIVDSISRDLGLDATQMGIEAHLYKLVLYETGGKFQKHQDTEKEEGMFGSLVIQIPSYHEGGGIEVHHKGKTYTYLNDKDKSVSDFYYTAFYADCVHEVLPITKGARVTMLFNLIASKTSENDLLTTSRLDSAISTFTGIIDTIKDKKIYSKFVLALEHQYTKANRHILKGQDAARIKTLTGLKYPDGRPMFFVALANLDKTETGSSEAVGYGRYDSDYEFGEIEEEIISINLVKTFPCGWPDINGSQLNFKEEEVLYDLDEETLFGDPTYEHYEGYQGNYPGTAERRYESSVVVFWPSDLHVDILLQNSLKRATIIAIDSILKQKSDFSIRLLTEWTKRGTFSGSMLLKLVQRLDNKELFLYVIEHGKADSHFYEGLTAAVKENVVSWEEVIPFLALKMKDFKQLHIDFIKALEDKEIQLELFQCIKDVKDKYYSDWLNMHAYLGISCDHLIDTDWQQKSLERQIQLFFFLGVQDSQKKLAVEIAEHLIDQFLDIITSMDRAKILKVITLISELQEDSLTQKLANKIYELPERLQTDSDQLNRYCRAIKYTASQSKVLSSSLAKEIEKQPSRIASYQTPCILNLLELLDPSQDCKAIAIVIKPLLPNCKALIKNEATSAYSTKLNFSSFLSFVNLVFRYGNAEIYSLLAKDLSQGNFSDYNSANLFIATWDEIGKFKDIPSGFADSCLRVFPTIAAERSGSYSHRNASVCKVLCKIILNHCQVVDADSSQKFFASCMHVDKQLFVETLADLCDDSASPFQPFFRSVCELMINTYFAQQSNSYSKLSMGSFAQLLGKETISLELTTALQRVLPSRKKQELILYCTQSEVLKKLAVNPRFDHLRHLYQWVIDYLHQQPLKSWIHRQNMPQLEQSYPDIANFLKQDQQTETFYTGQFSSIVQARKRAAVIRPCLGGLATPEGIGSGRSAGCKVSKHQQQIDMPLTTSTIAKLRVTFNSFQGVGAFTAPAASVVNSPVAPALEFGGLPLIPPRDFSEPAAKKQKIVEEIDLTE